MAITILKCAVSLLWNYCLKHAHHNRKTLILIAECMGEDACAQEPDTFQVGTIGLMCKVAGAHVLRCSSPIIYACAQEKVSFIFETHVECTKSHYKASK